MDMAWAARFTGYNNQKGDLQQLQMVTFRGLVEDKDSVSTKRPVKLSKNLFLQFIIEIDVKSWIVTVSHFTRTILVNINIFMKKYNCRNNKTNNAWALG